MDRDDTEEKNDCHWFDFSLGSKKRILLIGEEYHFRNIDRFLSRFNYSTSHFSQIIFFL